MGTERVPRRLAAILVADVVGYARLIRADEEATLAPLNSLRTEIIDPTIAVHDGRIFKLMGDGMLAEFRSVVEPVRTAVEIQRALAARLRNCRSATSLRTASASTASSPICASPDCRSDGSQVQRHDAPTGAPGA